MPYLNIVFHNIRHGGASINQPNSRAYYTTNFVNATNVFQTAAGPGRIAPVAGVPMAGWGNSVTGGNTACGIFLCESPPYNDPNALPAIVVHPNYAGWVGPPSAIPTFPTNYIQSGFTPFGALNALCAFLEGANENPGIGVPVAYIPLFVSPHWVGSLTQALRCLGTGAAALLNGQAPWGSDRYGILFQAANRTYPGGGAITGVFVHTKNTNADPGTQIAALCRHFHSSIIFGDLNLDLRADLKRQSLAYAVGATHTILAIQDHTSGNYYFTHYTGGHGSSCLDYALVPNAQVGNVELWAHQANPFFATLSTNHSDHSVMMLRIQCN